MKTGRTNWVAGLAIVLFAMAGVGLAGGAQGQTTQTNLAAVVRHAPNLNGSGHIDGSVQQLLGENVTLNGGFVLSGDLLVPGTPTLRQNGNPAFAGVIPGTGADTPAGYQVMLNGNCSLGYLRTRTAPATLPTVAAPPKPAGTRSVNINTPGQSIGNALTLKDLTLNGNVGPVAVPPGTYGTFNANGSGGFIFGVEGASTPAMYNLQSLNLNGSTRLEVVGPVILTLANSFTGNGIIGATNHSQWLQVQIASGGFTLNGNSTLHGSVSAPAGTVIINGGSLLAGTALADRLTINSGGLLRAAASNNQAPVANAQSLSTLEDSSCSILLAASDPEGAALTYSILSQPSHGTLSGSAPNLVYSPATNFYGSDSFAFKVNDGRADSAPATVAIAVIPVNDPPVAHSIAQSTPEDTAVSFVLSGSDGEGSPLTFQIVSLPTNGLLSVSGSNVVYSPSANYNGTDTFAYVVNDGSTSSQPALVTLMVQAVNDAPVVVDQTLSTSEDATLPMQLGGVDAEGDPVHFTILNQPAHGVLSGTPRNLVYTPTANYNGVDVFSYMGSDPWLDSDPATITLHITPVNDAPLAAGLAVETLENTATNLVLTGSDIDGDSLSFTVLTQPLHGTLNGIPPQLIYSPAANYYGTDRFTFIANDGQTNSNPATVEITVIPVNQPPIVYAGPDQTIFATSTMLHGTMSDDGLPSTNSLTVEWSFVSGPEPALFGNSHSLDTTAGFVLEGTYVLRLTASDSLASASSDVTITVKAPNRPPTVSARPKQFVMLGTNAALTAVVTDDGLPINTLFCAWAQISGPGLVTFSNPSSTNTTAAFTKPGEYVLRLSVSDSSLTGYADAHVVVRTPAMNQAPQVTAGADKVVGLTNLFVLEGNVADDGLPLNSTVSAQWSVVSGPGTVVVDDPSRTNASATFSAAGAYVLRLAASDSEKQSSKDVTITVFPFNQPPVVDAGPDITITLPDDAALSDQSNRSNMADVFLSTSLLDVPHWDNRIGQPGLDGYVSQINVSSDGSIYVVGGFRNAGGVEAHGSARWDGTNWHALYDPRPYSQGNYDPSVTNIAYYVYDCGNYEFCGEYLDCLTTRGSDVFVGGMGKNLAVDSRKDPMSHWTGTGWEPWCFKLGSARVVAMQATPDRVYVCGQFYCQPTNYSYTACPELPWTYNVAYWDGTNWGALGDGIVDIQDDLSGGPLVPHNTYVFLTSIAVATNGDVYVAGNFVMDTPWGMATNVAKWNGSEWEPLGGGVAYGDNSYAGVLNRYLAITGSGDVYIAGPFTRAGDVEANNLAWWDGQEWHAVNGVLSSAPTGIAAHGNDIYVTGLQAAGDLDVNGVARWDGRRWHRLGQKEDYGANGWISSITVGDQGVYIGGYVYGFTTAGNLPANNIALYAFPKQPDRFARLEGRVTDDGLPTGGPLAAVWSKVSGPGEVTFVNAANPVTTAKFSVPGTYVLRLSATDTELSAFDEVIVSVAVNKPPTVNAGSNAAASITEKLDLHATVVDDGLPYPEALTMSWSLMYGPGTVTFSDPYSTNTTVAFSNPGVYVLRFMANDTQFSSCSDVTITVLANTAPAVMINSPELAYGLIGIYLTNQTTLWGAISDDGIPSNVLVCAWSVVKGPGPVRFSDANNPATTASFVVPGSYTVRLTVSDGELSSSADMDIYVADSVSFPLPRISAGSDRAVPLSASLNLQGLVIDQPMNTLASQWSVVSGPGTVSFADEFNTGSSASFSAPGVYQLRLSVWRMEFYAIQSWYWDWGWFARGSDDVVITVLPNPGENQPPMVMAGPTRTLSLAQPLVLLQGMVSDDGLPSAAALQTWWTIEAIPDSGVVTLANSNAPITVATFSLPGTYVLALHASDSQYTNSNSVTIAVINTSVANQPPGVFAGDDQSITNAATLALSGSVSDDGKPGWGVRSTWSQVSGPATVAFDDPSVTNTVAHFNWPGQYVLRLTATDQLLTDAEDVVINVVSDSSTPIESQPLIVDAGIHQDLWLPTNSTTLNGFVRDDSLPAGAAVSVHWTVTQASGAVEISDPDTLCPTVTFQDADTVAAGGYAEYYFRLTVNDTVSERSALTMIRIRDASYPYGFPSVDAGPDQTITLPNSALLSPNIDNHWYELSSCWTCVTGPGPVEFQWDSAKFIVPGVYRLRISTFFDFDNPFANDDIIITVLPPNTLLPVVNAGPSRTIPQANPTVFQMNGSVTVDSKPAETNFTCEWTLLDGPDMVLFEDPSSPATTAFFPTIGAYSLRLSISNAQYQASSDTTITVFDPSVGNQPPVVTAMSNQTVPLTDTILLTGSVVDDGLPTPALEAYWEQVAGPATAIIDYGYTDTSVQFIAAGVYVFRLNASDYELWNSSDVVITVLETNRPPTVFAGFSRFVPNGLAIPLNAAICDDGLPTGAPLTGEWSVISGPAEVTFSPDTHFRSNSCATFTTPGDYVLRLTASDTKFTVSEDVTLTVFDAPSGNLPPQVSLPASFSGLPRDTIPMSATVSDDAQPAGSALSVLWSQVNGPAPARFVNTTVANAAALFSLPGVYVLQVTVNDGQLSTIAQTTVTISECANEPPAAYAGQNLEVTRPAAAGLQGEVYDDGLPLGYPLTYQWAKLSGPGTVRFTTSAGTASDASAWLDVDGFDAPASATFSSAGQYVLQLSASDSAFTNNDVVTITVLSGTNTPPSVDAGPNQTISLPAFATLHTGVEDDGLPNGTLKTSWSLVNGPAPVRFFTVNKIYKAAFTALGQYTLRLTATDGEFTNTDDVVITVIDTPPPVVQLTFPTDGAPITCPTQIVGTASSDILHSYQLQYRPLPRASASLAPTEAEGHAASTSVPLAPNGGEGQGEGVPSSLDGWLPFSTGAVSVINSPLGILDPTLQLNGTYEIRLTATDLAGRTVTTDPVSVILDRNLKVGQLTLSFNDLTVPVAGLPIQIVRTYDSRNKESGDFGAGWTLDLNNIRLQKNRSLSKGWEQIATGSADDLSLAYYLDPIKPRIVTITFPGGKTEQFQLTPSPSAQALIPIDNPQWNFTPLGATRGTLQPAGIDEEDGSFLYFAGGIPGMGDLFDLNGFSDWALQSGTGTEEALYRYPTLFRYTSPEGQRYLIDEIDGLRSVTDLNGNTLLVSSNGITWTNANGAAGLTIQFQRDVQNRITNIIDALGKSITYAYDAHGDLTTFTDRDGHTNGFAYDNLHHLISLTDARGIQVAQNTYDAEGRIIAAADALGNAVALGHDLANHREYITNRLGQVTVSEYDNHGNVTRVIDPLGGQTLSTYDDNGNVLQTVDTLGRTNTFTYDERDNRLTSTDPLGNTTRLTYGPMRRVTSMTDARGNVITNWYDGLGNLIGSRDALGSLTSFAYDHGQIVAMTNALGAVTRYEFDGNGRLTNMVDALGHNAVFVYDANGNCLRTVTTRTSPSGIETIESSTLYNAEGRPTLSVFPDGTTSEIIYNTVGQPAMLRDQLGRVTRFEYDTLGQRVMAVFPDGTKEASGYDVEGRVIANTNRLGFVTRYEYNAAGWLERVVYADGTSMTNYYNPAGQVAAKSDAMGHITTYGYDGAGRLSAVTNAAGYAALNLYDEMGNMTAHVNIMGRTNQYIYDALNRQVKAVYPDGASVATFFDAMGRKSAIMDAANHSTWFGYDPLGRLTSVSNAVGQVTRTEYNELSWVTAQFDPNNRATRYEHNSLGRVLCVIDADGGVEQTTYNMVGQVVEQVDRAGKRKQYGYYLMGRLAAVTNALGYVTRYEYDSMGRKTAQLDANLHRTTYEYDAMNRRARRTLPGGQFETYGYDAAGLLTSHTDFNGYTTTFEYDVLGRLLQRVPDARRGESPVEFAYNALGQRVSMKDASGWTTYRFDLRGRLEQKASPAGTLSYGYDILGNVTSIQSSNPNGVNISYRYDELSRLQEVNGPSKGPTTYQYDTAGNLHSYTHPNGVVTAYEYDNLNRLLNVSATQQNRNMAGYAYTLGAAGNRVAARETITVNTAARTINRIWDYDALYQLKGETISGNVTSGAITYQYDSVGNRLARGSSLPAIPGTANAFDADDRLTTDSYDANGNTIESRLPDLAHGYPQSVQDAYDFENHLVHRAQGPHEVGIVYDGDGNRSRKTVVTGTNIITTWYLVDELNPTGYAQALEELVSENDQPARVQRVYAYGHALLSQDQWLDNQWCISFYGLDGHNSVRYLTDASGGITDTFDYDAFGILIARTGATPNNYLFSGEQFDPDLGLYYLRARYHNPQSGRFWTQDAFEGFHADPGSLHKYSYVRNNPANAWDPSGYADTALTSVMGTVTLSPIARSLVNVAMGAVIGAGFGSWDAIFHGRINGNQIDQAAMAGATMGAVCGAVYSASSALIGMGGHAAVAGELLESGLVGVSLGLGAKGFGESLGTASVTGQYSGATFRLGLLGLGMFACYQYSYDMLQADLNSNYAQPIGAGAKTLQAAAEYRTAVEMGQIPVESLPPVVRAEQLRILRELNINPGNPPKAGIAAKETTVWNRLSTVGRTPGKTSATGRAVIERMRAEGKIMEDPVLGTLFQDSKGGWRPLADADMAHKIDAVTWWNETGRTFGAKAPEVRQWMLDPDNYTLDYFGYNRPAGAKLGETYLPPLK